LIDWIVTIGELKSRNQLLITGRAHEISEGVKISKHSLEPAEYYSTKIKYFHPLNFESSRYIELIYIIELVFSL